MGVRYQKVICTDVVGVRYQKVNCADVVCLEFCVMEQLAGIAVHVGQTLPADNTLVRSLSDVYGITHTHTLPLSLSHTHTHTHTNTHTRSPFLQ